MDLKDGDIVVFSNDAVGMFTDDDSGTYFKFGSLEENYKPEYHNKSIIAVIRQGKYHAVCNKERISNTVEGMQKVIDDLKEYTYPEEQVEMLDSLLDDCSFLKELCSK